MRFPEKSPSTGSLSMGCGGAFSEEPEQMAAENSATSLPHPGFKTHTQHAHAENFFKLRISDTFPEILISPPIAFNS